MQKHVPPKKYFLRFPKLPHSPYSPQSEWRVFPTNKRIRIIICLYQITSNILNKPLYFSFFFNTCIFSFSIVCLVNCFVLKPECCTSHFQLFPWYISTVTWLGLCSPLFFCVFFMHRSTIDRRCYRVTNGLFVVTEFIKWKQRHRPSAEFVIKNWRHTFFSLFSHVASFPYPSYCLILVLTFCISHFELYFSALFLEFFSSFPFPRIRF